MALNFNIPVTSGISGTKVPTNVDYGGVLGDTPKDINIPKVHKFLLMITQYPDGKMYPKIIPIGQDIKKYKKKTKQKKWDAISKVQEEVI